MKVGDYVYSPSDEYENGKMLSYVGRIKKIEDDDIYCHWSKYEIELLPKTLKDFNNIVKDFEELSIGQDYCQLLKLKK